MRDQAGLGGEMSVVLKEREKQGETLKHPSNIQGVRVCMCSLSFERKEKITEFVEICYGDDEDEDEACLSRNMWRGQKLNKTARTHETELNPRGHPPKRVRRK